MPGLLTKPLSRQKQVPPEHERNIVDYYRQTIADYQVWSAAGFMHFGLWRPWMNPFNRDAMLRKMNDVVFDALQLDKLEQTRIGDFGCGVGAVSIDGYEKFPSHRWEAYSICPEQVAFGNKLLAGKGIGPDEVRIDREDFSNLSLPDESLDGAFFLESLCHADDLRATLNESCRVLKPGGRLVVIDGMMSQRPERTPRWIQYLAERTCENWAVPQFHPRPWFEECVDEVGLELIDRKEIGWQVAPCVAHSPILIAAHSLKLIFSGRWNRWKRKHMIGCALGVLLGMIRNHFGYYVYTLARPV